VHGQPAQLVPDHAAVPADADDTDSLQGVDDGVEHGVQELVNGMTLAVSVIIADSAAVMIMCIAWSMCSCTSEQQRVLTCDASSPRDVTCNILAFSTALLTQWHSITTCCYCCYCTHYAAIASQSRLRVLHNEEV
jgi:hypothetical protein